jgi:hypothetical protein
MALVRYEPRNLLARHLESEVVRVRRRDGVPEVTIPKQAKAQRGRIEVAG